MLYYGCAQKIWAKEGIFTVKKKKYVGAAILAYIRRRGFIQKRIAQKAEIPQNTFNDMMHGRRDIHAEEYFRICDALGEPVSTFKEEPKNNTA
jgi:predicted XRE-type DNA-binding protein